MVPYTYQVLHRPTPKGTAIPPRHEWTGLPSPSTVTGKDERDIFFEDTRASSS